MATGISGAGRLRDDEDWSISHRDPPPIPTSRKSPTKKSFSPEPFPDIGVARSDQFGSTTGGAAPTPSSHHRTSGNNLRGPQQAQQPSRAKITDRSRPTIPHWPIIHGGETDRSASAATPTLAAERLRSQSHGESASRPRRGSIKELLRRTPTNPSKRRASEDQPQIPNNAYYTEPSPPPPIPAPRTLIAQAHQDAALNRQPSTGSNMSMLRKVSRSAQKREAAAEEEKKRKEAALRPPPHLPSLPPLAPFSEVDNRPDSVAIFHQAYTTSASPHPRPTNNFSRPTNMAPSSSTTSSSSPAYTSRGGGALVGSSPPDFQANPRRIRRKKDPTPFNILVIGAKNSGKTSFISLLQNSLSLPANKQPHGQGPDPQIGGNRSSFASTYLESDIDGERVGLTLWDSAGLEKNVVDLQLREMTAFIEAKFEETFAEEQKVMRTPGVKDTHIHCVFHILDPVRLESSIAAPSTSHRKGQAVGSLDDALDLQVMRGLWGKTTVIPIIAKADTLTLGQMSHLKRTVWQAVKTAKLDPLEALELEDDAEDDDQEDADDDGVSSADESGSSLPVAKARKSHNRRSSLSVIESLSSDDLPYLPMSIISPDPYDMPPYVPRSKLGDKIGRRFPWGFADPYNADHCDFGRLRDSVFSEWRAELRELSRSRWYEQWRTSRLNNLPGHKQRIPGGVTPVAAVPREGRIASQNSRNFSTQSHNGAANVPRSVSNLSSVTSANGTRVGTTISGGRLRGPSGTSEVGSAKNGTIRSTESQSQR